MFLLNNSLVRTPYESKGVNLDRSSGARNQQTARAGEYFVAAELNRRGAYAFTFAGNMPKIDILVSNLNRTRTVSIRVKTRRTGSWQTSIDKGQPSKRNPKETHFWVFVDLGKSEAPPSYYIVPVWWIRNDIYVNHQKYLAKHHGKRKFNPKSKHHGIDLKRIEGWKDRWDLLRVF